MPPEQARIDIHDDRHVVARGVAAALVAVDARTRHGVGKRLGPHDEVDPHPLILLEAAGLVVPERVALGYDGPHDVGDEGRKRLERGALRGGDVGGSAEHERRVAHVGVERGDVPVAHEGERQLGVLVQPGLRVVAERLEPVELVLEVRILKRATVGNIQAPESQVADGDAERARLKREAVRARALHLLPAP